MAKARILIVEDEIVVAQDIRLVLIQLGYEAPTPVTSGEAALACLEAVQPDLVLMDIHLAGKLDGVTTADHIRQRLSIPIVYLTAHADETTVRRANITEPAGYILKPFEERELAITIEIALYRHSVECKLRQMERWLASTLKSMGDAVITTDLHGRVTFMNQIAETLTGWNQAEALGRRFDDVLKLVDGHTRRPIADLVQRVIGENIVIEIDSDTLLITRDGIERPVDDSAAPIRDNLGHVIGVVVVFRDVAVRKHVEGQLRYSATHDPLTGLPNRALWLDRLTQVFEHARRHPAHKFAVLLLDLDRFKVINDSLGHLAGDQALIIVAERLEKELRANDTSARLGGDEYVVLLDGITHARDALLVAERIQKSLAAPIALGSHEVFVGASIGIVLSDRSYRRPDEILRDADTALYRAKAAGKSCNVIFDADLHKRAMATLRLENDLRRAVARREFLFHFQPIVSLTDGRVRGFEALLRWQHPERGLLLPETFLESAEETGCLNEVGGHLLWQACRQALALPMASADRPLTMSVNLSRRQFAQPNLVEQVALALSETGIEPNRLCLEVTEGVFADQEIASGALGPLHDLGVRLHLDDFGTGYSSLSLLQRAPIDALKIDRAFVQRLNGGGPEESTIVRAVMLLAREMRMDVIAEGIETAEQAAFLQALDCPYGQGYWFSKPLPAQDVSTLLGPKERYEKIP